MTELSQEPARVASPRLLRSMTRLGLGVVSVAGLLLMLSLSWQVSRLQATVDSQAQAIQILNREVRGLNATMVDLRTPRIRPLAGIISR